MTNKNKKTLLKFQNAFDKHEAVLYEMGENLRDLQEDIQDELDVLELECKPKKGTYGWRLCRLYDEIDEMIDNVERARFGV